MNHGFQTLCVISGIICFLYHMVIVIYAGITADFAWIWAAGGCILIGLKSGLSYLDGHPDSGIRFLITGFAVLLLTVMIGLGYLGSKVIRGMRMVSEKNLEYVIVLGAQVRGETVSRALKKRLDCAISYAKENPETVFFLSGGQGPGEDITEAEAMYRYLMHSGMNAERLIKEDRSTSTEENLRFCSELLEIRDRRIGILSNNFHVYRAGQMAKKQGYRHVSLIPALSDTVMQPHYVLREIFAVIKARVRGVMDI